MLRKIDFEGWPAVIECLNIILSNAKSLIISVGYTLGDSLAAVSEQVLPHSSFVWTQGEPDWAGPGSQGV